MAVPAGMCCTSLRQLRVILRQNGQAMTKLLRIGLAVNHSFAYYRGVLRGIAHYAETRPEWLLTSIVPEQESLRILSRTRPAGLIASIHVNSVVNALSSWRRPVVNVSAVLPGLRFPRVGVDNERVGQLAAAHFLERGLRHFAFVGPPDHVYSSERHAAFRQALEEAGHVVHSHHTPAGLPIDPMNLHWDLDPGVNRWLRLLPRPVGVFVPSDDWGLQVSEVCRRLGLRVPEEIALLGVDDDDLECEMTRPRLSSVIVPAERIGFEAAALLDRLISGERPATAQILVTPPGVATRRSTEVLAIDDRNVAAAVRFIREHAHVPLRVADVLKEVVVGRRTLERKCHTALGWGVGEEIRRAHLDLARRLLVRTSLPMKVVAERSGFTDFRHMAGVFRQEVGMAPTTYRRQSRG
jgi:LacI family transcriptional regulator